jgi:Pentapeptide repeats (8 copies)
MRPLSKSLSVALLVGCLVTAVAVAGEQECDGPYKGRTLTPKDLATVLRNHLAWRGSEGEPHDTWRANRCQAKLNKANLQEAILAEANLQGASLQQANLQEVSLYEANLQGAILGGANLQGALLNLANLQGANLQEAILAEANLQGANLAGANLANAVYEPNLEKFPILWTLLNPDNHLERLVFYNSPAGLIALREAFKKAGMRTQERQVTYAIERTRRLKAWNPFWEDKRPWREKLAGKSESLFSYVLFELPSHYGMAPGRALWGLLGMIPGFALFYWIALQHGSGHSGLWMIVPTDRLTRGRGHERVVRIRPQTAKTWRERLRGESRMLRTGPYFSLLSAFHLGWREFNVGTWIARMQPREYTLRATGWVRTCNGLQS